MEPVTLALASQVVAFIAPYVGKASEAFAAKIGEAAFEQCKRLYDAVHARFTQEASKDDGNASNALASLAKDPDAAELVEKKLARILQDDPNFADTLNQILQSGPIQRIEIGDDATAENNQMKNSAHQGSQIMHGGNKSIVKGNSMEIS